MAYNRWFSVPLSLVLDFTDCISSDRFQREQSGIGMHCLVLMSQLGRWCYRFLFHFGSKLAALLATPITKVYGNGGLLLPPLNSSIEGLLLLLCKKVVILFSHLSMDWCDIIWVECVWSTKCGFPCEISSSCLLCWEECLWGAPFLRIVWKKRVGGQTLRVWGGEVYTLRFGCGLSLALDLAYLVARSCLFGHALLLAMVTCLMCFWILAIQPGFCGELLLLCHCVSLSELLLCELLLLCYAIVNSCYVSWLVIAQIGDIPAVFLTAAVWLWLAAIHSFVNAVSKHCWLLLTAAVSAIDYCWSGQTMLFGLIKIQVICCQIFPRIWLHLLNVLGCVQ